MSAAGALGGFTRWAHRALTLIISVLLAALGIVLAAHTAVASTSTHGYDRAAASTATSRPAGVASRSSIPPPTEMRAGLSFGTSTRVASVVAAEAPSGGARFAVDSGGAARDLAPDVEGLARMHAEDALAGGARPTMSSAAFDNATGNVYFGESGSVPSTIDPGLAARMPSPSLEPWPAGNCAEFNACNAALIHGSSIEDLVYGTVRTRTGLPEFPCLNCQASLEGATYEVPEP